jgi:hypothetical protein
MADAPHADTARLRALIADGLGRAVVPSGARDVDALRIELNAGASAQLDDLAPEIVAAIARALGAAAPERT